MQKSKLEKHKQNSDLFFDLVMDKLTNRFNVIEGQNYVRFNFNGDNVDYYYKGGRLFNHTKKKWFNLSLDEFYNTFLN